MIHPTAIVHAKAKLDSTVAVGPYAVIDEAVEIGPDCVIGPHVYVTGVTTVGARNRLHAGCVLGDAPQDLKYQGQPTELRIGDDNVFREHATVHRSTRAGEATVIGSGNFLMANSHVAHNARLGNGVILANGALLAGHAVVEDRAFISGNCLVHQFARVGTLAMMQGGSAISKDLPPFTILSRGNCICGLNIVGLRRAGFTAEQRLELKRLYHLLFRSGLNLPLALAKARADGAFQSPASTAMLDFVAAARRGVCTDSRIKGQDPEADE